MMFKIIVVIAGLMLNQLKSNSVAPKTPPSVIFEIEWMLYSPKAIKMLLAKIIRHDFSLIDLNIKPLKISLKIISQSLSECNPCGGY